MTPFTTSVIDHELDSDYLIKHLFKQISEDEKLLFISEATRQKLICYKKDQNRDNARNLWKSLLIDSICIMKINDNREKLYADTKEYFDLCKREQKEPNDIRTGFLDKFSKIRNISTYGIDELAQYFDDFVDFENVL